MPGRALIVIAALTALALVPSSALAAPKKAQIKFSATTYSVAENAGTFNLVIQRSGNTSNTASANLSIDPPPASTAVGGGVDYTYGGPSSVTFAPGQVKQTIPVTIVDNNTANAPNKKIVFRLSGASPGGTQLKNNPATVTIIDNEGPGTLDFSTNAYTVVEGAGVATVTVNRSGASNLALSVDYATPALGATASAGSDYTPIGTPQTLTFNPGEISKTFQVHVTDDSNAEGPETVNLALSNPKNLSGGAAPQIGPNSPAVLTINDDDVSTFSFQSTLFSVGESAGTATVTVNRGGATNIPASVDYSTSNGTATAGSDYTATSGTLNFAAGETQKTFTVTILPDNTDEPNETVDLALSSGASSQLSIVDDDIPTESVQFSDTTYSVNEADGTATITVALSHPLGADTTVHYATSDGTGTSGSDYTATSGTLTFVAGETQKTFDIPILNPATPDPEDDETVTLTLSAPGASLVLGDPSTATLTIADDDPAGLLDFKSLTYSATETGGLATITVERVGGVGGPVAVDYATSDGTATAGSDYTATSGTLNWAAGDSADKTFTVPVAWDGRGEGPETINLTLSNADGADLGPNTASVIHIADDGASGPFQLTASSYSVAEAAGVATVTVTRPGGSLGGPVSVDYATSDGTAIAGSDYTATSGTLTFGPGELTKSFTVPVTSDGAAEGDESFQVVLSNPTGGANLGTPAGATVTIADDDVAPAGTPSGGTSGGGSAGGSNQDPAGPQSPAADKRAPKLTLSAKKIQKAIKAKLLVLTAKCDEKCTLAVVAKVGKTPKVATLGKRSIKANANKKVTIKVKLTKKALAQLTKALKRGKAKVTISVVATDAARNSRKASRTITVKA
jgi:Calx-beta domain